MQQNQFGNCASGLCVLVYGISVDALFVNELETHHSPIAALLPGIISNVRGNDTKKEIFRVSTRFKKMISRRNYIIFVIEIKGETF